MQGYNRAVRPRRALINEDWEQDIALLQDLFREMVVYAEVQVDATLRWSFYLKCPNLATTGCFLPAPS